MDNLDDSENNAKISDSAYSTSCSNSQSRRSHSSKSTHSGSNSSGSSGYRGKPSTSGNSNNLEPSKKDKDSKKKKQCHTEVKAEEVTEVVESRLQEPVPICDVPKEEIKNVVETIPSVFPMPDKPVETMEELEESDLNVCKDEVYAVTVRPSSNVSLEKSCMEADLDADGFSCAISMHDGVVMYTTQSLTTNLGFPKELWIGRSFIDFVHLKDRDTFASQITNVLAVPRKLNTNRSEGQSHILECTMVCRMRRYRCITTGYGAKERTYLPFLLKFSFKDVNEEDGNIVYLIIQATPFSSAFKTPNEVILDAIPFTIRHSAAGVLDYFDIEAVPYLGYLPQDILKQDALLLYHPDDLPYMKMTYETIVKEGRMSRSLPYRMLTQNGDYLKLETEWTSFTNPWSMKLEFVIGKHHVITGPTIPDVFQPKPTTKTTRPTENEKLKAREAESYREGILKILKDVLTKPAEKAKQQISKRCQDLAIIMESLLEEQKGEKPVPEKVESKDPNAYERDSVMLGGISPHHDYKDSKSSSGTPLSYNHLNYTQNLQRFFDSYPEIGIDETNTNPSASPSASFNAAMDPDMLPSSHCLSPLAKNSGDSSPTHMFSRYSPPAVIVESVKPPRLTETLLTKHNNEMEEELVKTHRLIRFSRKGERSYEKRQKKKEHLARCNAAYQPTMAGAASPDAQPHGVKRASEREVEVACKHHCPIARQTGQFQTNSAAKQAVPTTSLGVFPTYAYVHPLAVSTAHVSAAPSHTPQRFVAKPYTVLPQNQQVEGETYRPIKKIQRINVQPYTQLQQTQQFGVQPYAPLQQNERYGAQPYTPLQQAQPFAAQPYSPLQLTQCFGAQPYTPMQQTRRFDAQLYTQIAPTDRIEAQPYTLMPMIDRFDAQPYTPMPQTERFDAHPYIPMPQIERFEGQPYTLMPQIERFDAQPYTPIPQQTQMHHRQSVPMPGPWMQQGYVEINSQMPNSARQQGMAAQSPLNNSFTKHNLESIPMQGTPPNKCNRNVLTKSVNSGQISDENMERTDGESSYSSFYSSFFKTESGTADESSDNDHKAYNDYMKFCKDNADRFASAGDQKDGMKKLRAQMDPFWMNKMKSDLIFKYQIQSKKKEDVLKEDQERMKNLAQPVLVNEQLGQLYLDLQLEGVTSRLTLEEGITSSSSSGEEMSSSSFSKPKISRRFREFSKLHMIYEENAPLPPVPAIEATSAAATETIPDVKHS